MTFMMELIPSLLVQNQKTFEDRLRTIERQCKMIHVDILDGSLFSFISWFDAEAVGAIKTPLLFEIHLMVKNPLPIIEEWKRSVAGLRRAIIHAEIARPLGSIISHIHEEHKIEAGVAINPETPIEEIHEVLHAIDQITVLGVHPGQSGQAFIGAPILEKITHIHRHRTDLPIEIDGGVTEQLLPSLAEAGCTRFCAASAIFKADDPLKALAQMNTRLSTLKEAP